MTYPIDSTKIEAMDTRWHTFRGFTVLLHNPAEVNADGRLWAPNLSDSGLALYQALRAVCERLRLRDYQFRYSLCLVPPETYHCTFADGVHADNVDKVSATYATSIRAFLDGLPASVRGALPGCLPQSLYADRDLRPTRFRFRKLSMPGGRVLLARVEPADDETRAAYAELLQIRRQMSRVLESLGVGELDDWNPHITLGYCAVSGLGAELKPQCDLWEPAFREATSGLVVEYNAYRAAGFLDMQSYYFA